MKSSYFVPLAILFLIDAACPDMANAQACTSPGTTIYGITSSANIYPIAVSNANVGAKINPAYGAPAPNQANAIGYNANNGKFYYFKINPGAGGQQFFSFDPLLNVYATLATSPISASVHSGCVNFNGTGYYCVDVNGSLFYYNIALNTWKTISSNIVDQFSNNVSTVIQGQNAGDMAVDGLGNLWFLTSNSSNYGLYEISGPLPTAATATVTCKEIIAPTASTPGGSSFAGVAFNTTGQMYFSTYTGDDKLYLLNNNLTLTYIGTFNISGVGNDLTSCNYPLIVLAVNWKSFSAELQTDKQVSLTWTVSQQINNKGYYVEHSQDGTKWEQLGFIPNSGNDQEEVSYSYTHSSPASGENFYRIQQVDYNGSANYSATKTIQVENTSHFRLWPNPAKDLIHITAAGNQNMNNSHLRIIDRSGRQIIQNTLAASDGTINISSMSTGIYFVQVQLADGEIYNQKLIKQ